jgi:hypothetical protein
MAYVDSSPMRPSTPTKGKDAKSPNARLDRYWKEIEAYGKTSSDWKEQGEKIVKMYLDQHRTAASNRRFALLWSNIETMKPAVYAKTPNVVCSRRYKDPHPVGRTAAEILERATNSTFDLYRVDEVFRMVRDDRLLVSRGQAWVRYEASFKKTKDDKGAEYEKVSGEKVCVDYVHWCDFGHNVAGTWKDVWLVWRKVYKTRDEASKRFGEKIAEQLGYSAKKNDDGKDEEGQHVACIYELWDKKENQTVFISRDYPEFLEEPADPPLNFRDFFPCPEPCYGSKTGKSLIPTPDYRYYQDQAQEIDDLTEKIANLTDWLALKGFVPAGPSADGADGVKTMIERLQAGVSNNKTLLVPIESWAGFTDKGGASKLVDWLPIDIVIKALQGAIEARNQLVQDVYQITGIADILRGQTDPEETLGAQQLKAQTGQRRVRNTKDELSRFCRDIGQLVAEVIAEVFQPQTIADMTGYKYEPMTPPVDPAQAQMGGQPQMASPPMQPGAPLPAQGPSVGGQGQSPSGQTFNDEVIALLRNDRMRGFLIDIETDSTIQPDEDAEKQRRVEFVTAVGGFMREALPAAQMSPAIIPMLGETLLFMARGFRAGRSLEETIERSMQALQQQVAQSQGQPNPEVQKAQMEAQMKQQEMQGKAQLEQQKMEMEKEKMAQELQFKVQELELKKQEIAMKLQEMQAKMQLEQEKAQNDMQLAQIEAQQKQQIAEFEAQSKNEIAQREAEIKQRQIEQEGTLKSQQMVDQHGLDMQQRQHEFDQKIEQGQQMHGQKIKHGDEAHKIKLKRDDEIERVSAAERTKAEAATIKLKGEREASEPKKAKRISVKARDKDGRAAEYEVN